MKRPQNFLFLFLGVILGVAATLGFDHLRHVRALQALPLLDERDHSPAADEIPGVILSRRDGRLQMEIRGGMGNPHPDFQSLLREERHFNSGDRIWGIYFEPGVTMDDVQSTLKTMDALGVHRYFLGYSFYGKLVAP